MILLTGAAGYIGSHVASSLLGNGFSVVAIDNYSTGYPEFVNPNIIFHNGNVQDEEFLRSIFEMYKQKSFLGVIHLAGLKFAGESVKEPLTYFENNTLGTLALLKVMREFNLENFVYSSSCSVYGESRFETPIKESSELTPVSPYGRSKLFSEQILKDFSASYNVNSVILRYFNVAGGTPGIAADLSRHNLFPNLYRSISFNKTFHIFGNDYKTSDGTCVRDYVDVQKIAEAHVSVLEYLIDNKEIGHEYNLGSGQGFSVMSIVDAVANVTGVTPRLKFESRREGDPVSITADITKAVNDLGWRHEKNIEEIVYAGWEAWNWYKKLWS